MANNPLSMSKIRLILRLHAQGMSKHQMAERSGTSRNTLKKYLAAYAASGLTPEAIEQCSDKELEDLFVAPQHSPVNERLQTLIAYFPTVEKELQKKGATLLTTWQQYRVLYPEGLGKSQFKHYYAQWRGWHNPTMHQQHTAGDKCYIDFAGEKLCYTNPQTGEVIAVEVFLVLLGASQLTYVEAVRSQQKEDFITACASALHYFGGVPRALLPDNLKSAVNLSSRYERTLNKTFQDFAAHYGTTVLPARAYRPRDKALVEGAVRICYSRIYVPVRRKIYASLDELNWAIREALEAHNNHKRYNRPYSRRALFEELERSALMPLLQLPYGFKKQHYATVAKNGHVGLSEDKHYYSVPYRFIGRKVKVLYSTDNVEIFYNYERIALNARSRRAYQYSTDATHMASTHRFVAEWTPEFFTSWAYRLHEEVGRYVEGLLRTRPHPEQAYKACISILSLTKKVGEARLVAACKRGNS